MSDGTTPGTPETPPAKDPHDATHGAYQAASRPSGAGYLVVTGLVAFVAAMAWYLVEGESSVVLLAWVFVSALLVLGPLAWHSVDVFGDLRSPGAGRRLGAGAFVTLNVALALGVFGLVSAINVKWKDRLPQADLTATGRYTLGDETERILARADGTIYVTYVEFDSQETNPPLRAMAEEQVKAYARASPNVQVRIVNMYREREATESWLRSVGVLPIGDTGGNDAIVITFAERDREVVPGKQKEVRVDEYAFLKSSPMDGSQAWLGERVITSAIQELVFQRYKVYLTGGHKEIRLDDDARMLRERLSGQNLDVVSRELDLARSGRVPDDCDLLIVLGPQAPFSDEEQTAIEQYLDRGRAAIVCLDPDLRGRRETGLERALDRFGIQPRVNYVVLAPKVDMTQSGISGIVRMLPGFALTRSDYADHPAVRGLRERASLTSILWQTSYLEIDAEPQSGREVDPVAWASEIPPEFQSNVRPHAAQISANRTEAQYATPDPARDKTGVRLPVIAAAKRAAPADAREGARDSRLVVVADADSFSDGYASRSLPNLDLFTGLVQWSLRREDLVAVSDKTLENLVVTIDERKERMAWVFPLAMAVTALLAGAGVWWSRRR